jgi:hypothetical protein
MWHYPMCRHYPMCFPMLPYFPILMQSSLHLVIFKHPYLTPTKSNFINSSAMNLTLHFLHIYHLDFHLKEKNIAFNL